MIAIISVCLMHYSAIIPNKHIALSPLVAVFETRVRNMIHKKIKQVKARIQLDALELINARCIHI